jgi:hypothetical protein
MKKEAAVELQKNHAVLVVQLHGGALRKPVARLTPTELARVFDPRRGFLSPVEQRIRLAGRTLNKPAVAAEARKSLRKKNGFSGLLRPLTAEERKSLPPRRRRRLI